MTLAQLGFLDEQKFLSLFELGENQPAAESSDRGYMTVKYSEIVGKQYTLFYNDAVYAKNADYQKPTLLSPTAGYPFTYQGVRSTLQASEEQGVNLKISGILRLKEGLTYGCLK
ncbi:MAG: hypothetical protein K2L87_04655, partial [Clostridiales bacterium]|nr:hypothetical protein [Clostridiales bacterium]